MNKRLMSVISIIVIFLAIAFVTTNRTQKINNKYQRLVFYNWSPTPHSIKLTKA